MFTGLAMMEKWYYYFFFYLAHINSRSDNWGNFEVEYRQWEQAKEEESKKVGVLPKNLIRVFNF